MKGGELVIILGTTVLGDKDYKEGAKVKTYLPISHEEYGLTDDFYGGNVSWIATIEDENILLLCNNDDGMNVISLALKSFEPLTVKDLKTLAKQNNLKFDWQRATKDEVTDLLKCHYGVQ
jgi:hypothetical protein